jgi:hypothetical protein
MAAPITVLRRCCRTVAVGVQTWPTGQHAKDGPRHEKRERDVNQHEQNDARHAEEVNQSRALEITKQ